MLCLSHCAIQNDSQILPTSLDAEEAETKVMPPASRNTPRRSDPQREETVNSVISLMIEFSRRNYGVSRDCRGTSQRRLGGESDT